MKRTDAEAAIELLYAQHIERMRVAEERHQEWMRTMAAQQRRRSLMYAWVMAFWALAAAINVGVALWGRCR